MLSLEEFLFNSTWEQKKILAEIVSLGLQEQMCRILSNGQPHPELPEIRRKIKDIFIKAVNEYDMGELSLIRNNYFYYVGKPYEKD